MLYPKNKTNNLSIDLFRDPSSEYRGAPFWAWNCRLDKKLVETQIEYLKEMGFGGFHMHSRTGMDTPYLSDEFMGLIKACVQKAEKENMLAWLYDEDRWPSGAAGGIVTKDPKYRIRKLVFTPEKKTDIVPKQEAILSGRTYLIGCYGIVLDLAGELSAYEMIDPDTKEKTDIWYAYSMTNSKDPWFNYQTYVDTLCKEAIDKFIEVTYEKYKEAVGSKFGSIVPAIFTDEPLFERKIPLNFAKDKTEVILPWTNDLLETYLSVFDDDLLKKLPELIWELPDGGISVTRYHYHDHIAERFAKAFADNCGKWCEENNLMLTGHMMEEPTLESQSNMIGDTMRSYRSFQLPGIDMLCDNVEFTTAKQAQSAAHQYGREGVLSELYGVTNWDFDFRGHKFQGDWQAALGVTLRVHHLSWVSMAGEAKRDYPASINYQSPWYKEYPYVEDHFARISTALTRGIPIVSVGMIHPVESYWLHMGPKESTSMIRDQLDNNFCDITNWLLFGHVDFDYICESLLEDQCVNGSNPLRVGKMKYSTIIVPGCETLRSSTLIRLKQFKKAGGKLIFVGNRPKYINAVRSNDVSSLYDESIKTSFDRSSILSCLKEEKVVDMRKENGEPADHLIYQLRQDNICKWLFIAHGAKTLHKDSTTPKKTYITVSGEYSPELYDTITGEIHKIGYEKRHGKTFMTFLLNCHDSLLIRLNDSNETTNQMNERPKKKTTRIDFKQRVPYSLSEPNVLLLDMAEYSFDDGSNQAAEEILRIDNKFRKKLGYPEKQKRVAQPWIMEKEVITHYLTLKFRINSELDVKTPILALEDAKNAQITLNEVVVPINITGYYVDGSIKTVCLPDIFAGENILTVRIPFGRRTNSEYMYLLGDFNVLVEGFCKTIIPSTNTIGFSSITCQGLPFYGGNISYKTQIKIKDSCAVSIKANNYRGALIKVIFDGIEAGVIVYSPYKIMIENVSPGKHDIEFILFGNRHNTFGALHNADTSTTWFGPGAWRTTDDSWCYEYKLKETGILSSPVIEIIK